VNSSLTSKKDPNQSFISNTSSVKVSAKEYHLKKEIVKEVFLTKDELFSKINNKFKRLLNTESALIRKGKEEKLTLFSQLDEFKE